MSDDGLLRRSLEMLEINQWANFDEVDRHFCLECPNMESAGHTDDCHLAKLLADLRARLAE